MHLIIFMWGFTGIVGKLIAPEADVLVWYRMLIAAIGLAIAFYFLKVSFRVSSRKQLLYIIGVGVIVALHWITFFKAIALSTASLGILCLSTVTLHVTWLEPIIMKRRFSWLEFAMGLLVIFGIYFVSRKFDPQQYEALAYGLFSALCAALFAVFNAKLAQTNKSAQITFYEMLSGTVFVGIALLFQGKMNAAALSLSLWDFLWLLFLGLLCTSFAFLATIEVVRKLGAFTVSLSINLEPVYTILLAIIILHENDTLSDRFYVGSAIIILVVVANAVIKHYLKMRQTKKESAVRDLH